MNTKESFIITGLAGERKLKGSVSISGAKNAALKAVAAAVLFDGPVTLKNVPHTSDMETIATILEKLGATIDRNENGAQTLIIDPNSITATDIDSDLAKGMRASVVLTGPLLARFGKVSFPAPGGCVIGARPIDLFLSGYKKMGAEVVESETTYSITASSLSNTEIFFNKVTVGGTETLMMAAVLAKGKTVLKNCAMEPEIVNVAEWLNSCGAKISGVGTPIIEIEGTDGKLLTPKEAYIAIPDRIEAGSYLILGALCAEELIIENCEPKHMEAVTELLIDAGVSLTIRKDSITVRGSEFKIEDLKAITSLRTHEYPGFPTDLQSPLVTFLTQTHGESIIFETIFEGRFKYVEDLTKIGADITIMNPREILVKGPSQLAELPSGEELTAHDIRAGFAVVLAALIGKGKFTVNNIHLIDRGYGNLEGKLKMLGAEIERVAR